MFVAPAALPVHAETDAFVAQEAREGNAGKLRALVRVEDLGVTEARDGLLDRSDAEDTVERDRDAPGQDASARPVHHCPRSFRCEARSK